MNRSRITLMVVTDDPEVVTRTTEHLARAAAGMAMDGVSAVLMFGPDDEEEDDGPE